MSAHPQRAQRTHRKHFHQQRKYWMVVMKFINKSAVIYLILIKHSSILKSTGNILANENDDQRSQNESDRIAAKKKLQTWSNDGWWCWLLYYFFRVSLENSRIDCWLMLLFDKPIQHRKCRIVEFYESV